MVVEMQARRRWTAVVVMALVGASSVLGGAAAQTRDDQAVLGPGLYAFQMRITEATCGDADRTGFVSSFYGAIDGIPGARHMVLRLLNSRYWPQWELDVDASGTITATSRNERIDGTNRFEVRRDGERFTGTGTRTYRRGQQRCSVSYDALLRRIDR